MDAKTGIKRSKRKICVECGKSYKKSTGFCPRCYKKSCDTSDFQLDGKCSKCSIGKANHRPPMRKSDVLDLVNSGVRTAVPIELVVPNRWNPNKMPEDRRVKLWLGMLRVLRQQAELAKPGDPPPQLPPLLVRPLPAGGEHQYEIIDGEQRWKLLKDNQQHELIQQYLPGIVNVVVLNVDEVTARLLTSTMNWLHGDADSDRYVDMLSDIWKSGMTTEQMAELLPESQTELEAIAANHGINIEQITIAQEELDKAIGGDTRDELVEVKVLCYAQQAELIMGALNRVGSMLTGKNILARALELICADSLATPAESFAAKIQEMYPPAPEKPKKTKKGSLKEKLAAKAKKSAREEAAES